MATIGVVGAAQLVAAAAAVAATAQQVKQSRDLAAQQVRAANKKNDQIVESTVSNYDQLSEAELESQNMALDNSLSMQKDYLKSKGRVNVLAAAMGTGGQSVSSQLGDLQRTKYSNYNTILQNRQADLDNIADQATSLRYNAAAAIDTTPISRPSWASAALSAGSIAASGYSKFSDTQKLQKLADAPAKQTERSGV